MDRRAIGQQAEERAARLLVAAGATILLRNYRCRLGELDIVARHGPVLAIVEVRLRASAAFGGAGASVTRTKQQRIVRATRHLLARQPGLQRLPVRFDVVLIADPDAPPEWIRAAFDAA
ncbi:MAG TPA: YraN family protein [Steroidobacteraceae bacterium]|nr:YraN family protein [Steroidobacteraceae bacterium]